MMLQVLQKQKRVNSQNKRNVPTCLQKSSFENLKSDSVLCATPFTSAKKTCFEQECSIQKTWVDTQIAGKMHAAQNSAPSANAKKIWQHDVQLTCLNCFSVFELYL